MSTLEEMSKNMPDNTCPLCGCTLLFDDTYLGKCIECPYDEAIVLQEMEELI